MADSPSLLPSRLLVKAISASLKFVNESADSLTTSQLVALQIKLSETQKILSRKVVDRERSAPENQKIVVEIEDSDSDHATDEEMEIDGGKYSPLPIPGSYPLTPPQEQEVVDTYYVVDCGREVGIFTDNAISTRAISGVPHGHQVKVRTWHDAATHYNSLHDSGLITRVRV